MKARIFSTAILIAMTFAISCNDDSVSPQGPAGLLQENAVIVHAIMDEGTTKVTLGDDSGARTQVHWDSAGTSLYCWTATPWPDSANAINLYFNSGSQNLATNHAQRVIGCSVRCCKE